MNTQSKSHISRTIQDYLVITIGLLCYSLGWVLFLLPYEIATGGTSRICAIIEYSTGFEMQWSYLILNAVLLVIGVIVLGPKIGLKTLYGIGMVTLLMDVLRIWMADANGQLPQLLGPGQDFMACLWGAGFLGFGMGLIFVRNGSTGGTDIIALIVNKYKNISLGQMMMVCDVVIISSCYFLFHDWKRVLFGFTVLFVMGFVIDHIINRSKQSVQFFIFSKKYAEVADAIATKADRGVTLLEGQGWYSKQSIKVILVVAREDRSVEVFRQVKDTDPEAFISLSNVEGVYGKGFEPIKIK